MQEPIEIPFDTCNLYVNRFSGAKRQKVQSMRSFMYIPLFDSLAQLLQNKEVLREIHAVRASDSLLKDYSDGSLCKNHPLIAESPTDHCLLLTNLR